MKKLLAIILSVIMLMSLGVASFAEDTDQPTILIPDFPVQTENCVQFASETAYVLAGETVDIPIYIVSDYETETEGDILIGLNVTIASERPDDFEIIDLNYSDEIKAYPGFKEVVREVKTFDDSSINTISFTVSDKSILKEEKLPIAIATVKVADTYPGGNTDCILELLPAQHYWYDNVYGWYAMEMVEIWSPIDEEGYAEPLEVLTTYDIVFPVSGHILERPPVPTWEERLTEWFTGQSLKIITFLIGVLEIIQGFLLAS